MSEQFSVKSRVRSFKYAFKGLKIFFVTQHNAWIHLAALLVVSVFGFYLKLNLHEWVAIVFAVGLVLVTEIINTAIEFLTDHVSPEYHEQAGKVKDIAAAAVLMASIVALIIAGLVFVPKLIS